MNTGTRRRTFQREETAIPRRPTSQERGGWPAEPDGDGDVLQIGDAAAGPSRVRSLSQTQTCGGGGTPPPSPSQSPPTLLSITTVINTIHDHHPHLQSSFITIVIHYHHCHTQSVPPTITTITKYCRYGEAVAEGSSWCLEGPVYNPASRYKTTIFSHPRVA